jgi:hypothetical protein
MPDRIVVLRDRDPFAFVADACAAVADAVNEPHAWSVAHDELVDAYAAMLRAHPSLVRHTLPDGVTGRIIDHVLERLGQAERGEIVTPVTDILDRLHGLLVNEPAVH